MPTADGFRMPGEFEPHRGCWMLWPQRPDNWRLAAGPAQYAWVAVAAAIAASEPLTVGASARQFARARRMLPKSVRVVRMASNDAWMRDVGPTFVTDRKGRRRGVDWRFNAWGGLQGGVYWPWTLDDRVARQVLVHEKSARYRAPIILEGGAIHVDGQGTLITTEECLLHGNRNPKLSRSKLEVLLRAYLGVQKIIWLGRGVYNDETDGHVDNLCCFVKPGVVCLTWTNDRRDPMYRIVRDAEARLKAARDARGRRFKIHKLYQPGPFYMTADEARGVIDQAGSKPRKPGERLAGSYVNFYIGNKAIVMPLLDAKRDGAAIGKLRKLFPRRRVVGVPAREILLGGGNIHCITQQVPRG
ncbi:MAG TPA: agmatine deiminase [Steroidobacteraceae bacterium]|nr:agmatine deiminase [Steroidobacteraceae bacterium]